MRISVTYTDPDIRASYDIDVNTGQKMEDTIAVLVLARLIGGKYAEGGVRIMSMRTGLVFPASLSYREAGIYQGDSLRLIPPETAGENAREGRKGVENGNRTERDVH